MKTLRNLLRLGLIAIVVGFPSPAIAGQNPDLLTVGVYQNPPKVFLNGQGEAQGFWPDIITTIAQAENWQVQYVPCYWDQFCGPGPMAPASAFLRDRI
jgi:ABC-type amino acid transport substrate-binding protein